MEIQEKREQVEKVITKQFEDLGFTVLQTWWHSDPMAGGFYGFGCGLRNQHGAEFVYEQRSGIMQTK